MNKHSKTIAAINAVRRMKKAVPVMAPNNMHDLAASQPTFQFPADDHFYMMTDGVKFYCMQRGGTHDEEHASFFSEAKCRGHMKNSHNLS